MRNLEEWLSEYEQSHRNPINQAIHKICVPLILWSLVGFFSLLRISAISDSIFTSSASLLSLLSLGFYFQLGIKPFVQMAITLGSCLALSAIAEHFFSKPWILYTSVFVLAWIGQAVGHTFEGKKPSFFKDLQFLLIGPLWVFRKHELR